MPFPQSLSGVGKNSSHKVECKFKGSLIGGCMRLNLMQQQYRSTQKLCGIAYSNLQQNYCYSMVIYLYWNETNIENLSL